MSSCGDERIIVFTTDRLDLALLRGRMDVLGAHVLLHSMWVQIAGFQLPRDFSEIEEMHANDNKGDPCDIGEQLMKEPEIVLRGLMVFLEAKLGEGQETEAVQLQAAEGEEEEEETGDSKKQEDTTVYHQTILTELSLLPELYRALA